MELKVFVNIRGHHEKPSCRVLGLKTNRNKMIGRKTTQRLGTDRFPFGETAYFSNPSISRIHAFFRLNEQVDHPAFELTITDTESRHGTKVNGLALSPWVPHVLARGDIVTLGTNSSLASFTSRTVEFEVSWETPLLPQPVLPSFGSPVCRHNDSIPDEGLPVMTAVDEHHAFRVPSASESDASAGEEDHDHKQTTTVALYPASESNYGSEVDFEHIAQMPPPENVPSKSPSYAPNSPSLDIGSAKKPENDPAQTAPVTISNCLLLQQPVKVKQEAEDKEHQQDVSSRIREMIERRIVQKAAEKEKEAATQKAPAWASQGQMDFLHSDDSGTAFPLTKPVSEAHSDGNENQSDQPIAECMDTQYDGGAFAIGEQDHYNELDETVQIISQEDFQRAVGNSLQLRGAGSYAAAATFGISSSSNSYTPQSPLLFPSRVTPTLNSEEQWQAEYDNDEQSAGAENPTGTTCRNIYQDLSSLTGHLQEHLGHGSQEQLTTEKDYEFSAGEEDRTGNIHGAPGAEWDAEYTSNFIWTPKSRAKGPITKINAENEDEFEEGDLELESGAASGIEYDKTQVAGFIGSDDELCAARVPPSAGKKRPADELEQSDIEDVDDNLAFVNAVAVQDDDTAPLGDIAPLDDTTAAREVANKDEGSSFSIQPCEPPSKRARINLEEPGAEGASRTDNMATAPRWNFGHGTVVGALFGAVVGGMAVFTGLAMANLESL